MEFSQVMKNIKSFLEKSDLKKLQLEEIKKEFDEKLLVLEEALKPLEKSDITKRLKELDSQRGVLLVGYFGHCRAFVHFPENDKALAAQKLVAISDKYGKNIHNKPLQEETGIINSLLQDLSVVDNMKAVYLIGAEKWIENLGKVNKEFEQLHNKRTEEQGSKVVGQTKDARTIMNDIYIKLIKSINALSYINGEEKYKSLAKILMEEINRARLQANKKKSKDKEKDKETNKNIEKDSSNK